MSPQFTRNALRALADPDTKVNSYEMTPERKEKWSRICSECIDLLRARTEGPVEAYGVLQAMMHAFEDCYGIRGGMIMQNSDREQS